MKYKLIGFFIVVFGLLGLPSGFLVAGVPIQLAFHDTTIASGSVITYPIYVDSSLSGYTVTSYQLEFTYNTSYLKFDSASSLGTISGKWGPPVGFEISPGRVRITSAGADTLAGKGILVYLKLHSYLFTGLYNGSSSFIFQSSLFNEGFPTTSHKNGTMTLTPGPSIVISPNTALLTKGDVVSFTASGGTTPYTWSTTSPSVATISAAGALTGLSAGFTNVVCMDANSYVDTSGLVEVRAFKLSFRDTSRYQGQSMNIPVYCTDLTGLNITAGQFDVTFNKSLWTLDSVINAGTLLSAYATPTYAVDGGTMSISFAGTTPLSGSGILLYLRMKATTSTYGGSSIGIQNSVFNETLLGNAVSANLNVLQLPVVTVSPGGAQTLVVGDSLHFTASGGTTPYTWSVSDTAVASVSAAGWLQPKRSGDITVSAMDVIGGSGSSGVVSIYDFRLNIPDTVFIPNSVVQVPLTVTSNKVGFSSVQFVLSYNTNTYIKNTGVVSTGTLTSGFTYASSYDKGTSKIAAAGVDAVTGGGTLMILTFEVPDSTPISSTTNLTLSSVIFNEGYPRALVHNGSLGVGNRAIISVVPSSASMNAPVGQKDSIQLTVNNVGNITLTSTITVSGSSAFTVSLSNINVSPGGNVKPKIYFQPAVSGLDSAEIVFNTNDPFHSIVRIPVKGTTNPVSVEDELVSIPKGYRLDQNYPNPFNPATVIKYSVGTSGYTALRIFDIFGRHVETLVDGNKSAGSYQVIWNANGVASGVYFYQLQVGNIMLTKKMVLMK